MDFVSRSLELTRDVTAFTIGSLKSSLPGYILERGDQILDLMRSEVPEGLVDKLAAFNPVYDRIRRVIGNAYVEFDLTSRVWIDPVIAQFAHRYPSSSTLIGSSLADRVALICWLIILFGALWWCITLPFRAWAWLFRKRRVIKKPFTVALAPYRPPAQQPSESSTPEPTPRKEKPPHTVKKKLVSK